MQLKEHRSLRTALTTATCGLLGITSSSMAASDPIQADTAVLYYTEKNRVTVAETAAILTIPIASDETFTVSPTVDTITGASPVGAIPSNSSQTIGGTVTLAGQLPLQQFSDVRYSLSLQWQYPIDRMNREVVGAAFSTEKDYDSLGVSYSHMWDLDNKLTTITAGISGSLDSVKPSTGIVPEGLTALNVVSGTPAHAVTSASGGSGSSSGSTSFNNTNNAPAQPIRSKQIVDGLVGITRVINRRTLMQFNYGAGSSSGYLTDPYKVISLIDASSGGTSSYITEQRPRNRLRQTLYWHTVLHLPSDIIHISYRRYWDDWQIVSDTVDFNYHFKFGGSRIYIEPQLRYYAQSAADFYHYSVLSGASLPQYASADFRLAAMTSYTYALKLAVPISSDGEISLHGMVMRQTGNSHPDNAIGAERNQNLFPGLDASSIQLNLSFKF